MKKFKINSAKSSHNQDQPKLTSSQRKFLKTICGKTKVPKNLMKILRNRVASLDSTSLKEIRMGGGSTAWNVLLNFTNKREFAELIKNSTYDSVFGRGGIAQLVYSNIAAAIFTETVITLGLEKGSEILDIVNDLWEIDSLKFNSHNIKIVRQESIFLALLIAEALKPENSEMPFSWIAETSPSIIKLKRLEELKKF